MYARFKVNQSIILLWEWECHNKLSVKYSTWSLKSALYLVNLFRLPALTRISVAFSLCVYRRQMYLLVHTNSDNILIRILSLASLIAELMPVKCRRQLRIMLFVGVSGQGKPVYMLHNRLFPIWFEFLQVCCAEPCVWIWEGLTINESSLTLPRSPSLLSDRARRGLPGSLWSTGAIVEPSDCWALGSSERGRQSLDDDELCLQEQFVKFNFYSHWKSPI